MIIISSVSNWFNSYSGHYHYVSRQTSIKSNSEFNLKLINSVSDELFNITTWNRLFQEHYCFLLIPLPDLSFVRLYTHCSDLNARLQLENDVLKREVAQLHEDQKKLQLEIKSQQVINNNNDELVRKKNKRNKVCHGLPLENGVW